MWLGPITLNTLTGKLHLVSQVNKVHQKKKTLKSNEWGDEGISTSLTPLLTDRSKLFFKEAKQSNHTKSLSTKVTKRGLLHHVITLPCDFPEQKVQGKKTISASCDATQKIKLPFYLFFYYIAFWREGIEGLSPLMCGDTPDLNATISQLSC